MHAAGADERIIPWLAFWHLGFAVELHARWLEGPWLGKSVCSCHPEAFARFDSP